MTLDPNAASAPPRESWYRRFSDRVIARFEDPETKSLAIHEFLPAALEIQSTPPSPLGRIVIWVIMSFFVVALVWLFVGKVDIVAVASGKIIPSSRVKKIQPLEIGTVRAIHVGEGQRVEAGQELITLDNTQAEADTASLSIRLMAAQLDVVRLQIFDELIAGREIKPGWEANARERFVAAGDGASLTEAAIARQMQLLGQQVSEFVARRDALQNEVERRQAELEGIEAGIRKLEQTLPLVTDRADSLKRLNEQGMIARAEFLEIEQLRIEVDQDLKAVRAQRRETEAVLRETLSQRRSVEAEYRRDNLSLLAETRQLASIHEQDLVKATQRNRLLTLHAPIDGTVQQVAIHTVGGVVTPAQDLMTIVPTERVLEVEAMVLNKDIGFVEEGQVAAVKVDTFNFTKYGLIDARIVDLSNDAIQDEERGLVYQARVRLDDDRIRVAEKWVNLSPGMSVTVEVKTGERRLIEFFMSPLLRYRDESVRER